jgi:sulfur carrier protein
MNVTESIVAEGTVEVLLDGRPHPVAAGTTLAGLLETLEHQTLNTATAVNGSFVPRSERAARVLARGDMVLLFKPIVGG